MVTDIHKMQKAQLKEVGSNDGKAHGATEHGSICGLWSTNEGVLASLLALHVRDVIVCSEHIFNRLLRWMYTLDAWKVEHSDIVEDGLGNGTRLAIASIVTEVSSQQWPVAEIQS